MRRPQLDIQLKTPEQIEKMRGAGLVVAAALDAMRDAIAPGVNIYSTYKGGGFATMSGTSMASPHAAGVAALYLAINPGASPEETKAAVLRSSGFYGTTGTTDEDGIVFGRDTWRAINGDYDSGYPSYMDGSGYEPLVDAASFLAIAIVLGSTSGLPRVLEDGESRESWRSRLNAGLRFTRSSPAVPSIPGEW